MIASTLVARLAANLATTAGHGQGWQLVHGRLPPSIIVAMLRLDIHRTVCTSKRSAARHVLRRNRQQILKPLSCFWNILLSFPSRILELRKYGQPPRASCSQVQVTSEEKHKDLISTPRLVSGHSLKQEVVCDHAQGYSCEERPNPGP